MKLKPIETDTPKFLKRTRSYISPGGKKLGYYGLYLCGCGNEFETMVSSVKSGHTKSCGCFKIKKNRAVAIKRNTTHGKSKSKEYNIWNHMKMRCYNSKNKKFESYGGRGITVCAEWLNSFEQFLSDMGKCPANKTSIGRIDNCLGYAPDNCRWEDSHEQANNKRSTRWVYYKGQRLSLALACREANVNYSTALYRINNDLKWAELPEIPNV